MIGLVKNQKLERNILTPTTKAADHDVPVTPDEVTCQCCIVVFIYLLLRLAFFVDRPVCKKLESTELSSISLCFDEMFGEITRIDIFLSYMLLWPLFLWSVLGMVSLFLSRIQSYVYMDSIRVISRLRLECLCFIIRI